MLAYVYTHKTLGQIKTPYALPFELEPLANAEPILQTPNKIYVTSAHYLQYIRQALGKQAQHLKQLGPDDAQRIEVQPNFPIDFKNKGFKTAQELTSFVDSKSQHSNATHFAVMNGIGNGLGDHLSGLGCVQQLSALLAPREPHFHFLQELNYRNGFVCSYEADQTMRHSILSLEQFLRMDFVIDLSDSHNLPSFDKTPAAIYNAYAFSINHLVEPTNLCADLSVRTTKVTAFREYIEDQLSFEDQASHRTRPIVLLHPKASTDLRTMPPSLAGRLIRALIQQGFYVVSAFKHANAPNGFCSLDTLSNSVDDLMHIVAACDGVVSVGTVVYHIAAGLNKPTIVLPTVWPDYRSAELLSSVKIGLGEHQLPLLQNLHKSKQEDHLAKAQALWQTIDPSSIAQDLSQMLSPSSHGTPS